MDNKTKELFLNSLNDYIKGEEYLKETIEVEDKYTLMGVFCDIFKHKLKANWIENPLLENRKTYYLLGSLKEISKILLKKLKVKSEVYEIIKNCQKKYKNEPDFKKEIVFLDKNIIT